MCGEVLVFLLSERLRGGESAAGLEWRVVIVVAGGCSRNDSKLRIEVKWEHTAEMVKGAQMQVM